MEVITVKTLTKALRNTLGKKGVSEEELKKLAEYVMSFFGFYEYVVDNKLRPKDRDIFYMFEEEGLLTTMRDEVTITKGKVWRIHYWILKREEILRLAEDSITKETVEKAHTVYEDLEEVVWKRGK